MSSWYAIYGMAALISMLLPREDSPLLAVVVSLGLAIFGGYIEVIPEVLKKMSYAWW
jgi:hypothetical protein